MKRLKIVLVCLIAITLLLAATVAVLASMVARQDSGSDDPHKVYYDNKCKSYYVQNTNLAKGQIVFIGDSITDLYVLDEHYADLPLAVYNRGVGGDNTEGVLARLEVSIFDIAPSKVVLMIGTNDINGGIESDTILQRYAAIINRIYEELPQVELYCMSIIPQNEKLEEYSSIDVEKTTSKIIEINERIKQIATASGATYLDLFSLLSDSENRLIEKYSDDGIHLNREGLSVWTKLLKPYLTDSAPS